MGCSCLLLGDMLFHFIESHSELESTVGPMCILVEEAAGLAAVGGFADQRYWRL